MSFSSLPGTQFLQNADRHQLEQAAADNHKQLFSLNAICRGGEVITGSGLTYTYSGPHGEAMIAFPSLNENTVTDELDRMINYYHHHIPGAIGCWSLHPPQPADLGIRLLARGFQPGWLPGWMSLDLQKINPDYRVPKELKIITDNETMLTGVKDLPYAGEGSAVSAALLKMHPDRAQRFIALLNNEIVAQSAVFFSGGEYGNAGIYNVAVVPAQRKKGIGKAIVTAACRYAIEKGYHYATLNGTGRRMYEQIGFNFISHGITWWLMNPDFIRYPATKKEISMAEAVGMGNIPLLDSLCNDMTKADFDKPVRNGMTLLQFALHFHQPGVAEWLLNHGATCTVLDAWDLNRKEHAAALLQNEPQLINTLYGDLQITLLHIAAQRRDAALAKLALTAKPDLTIKDKTYNATALGWARYFGAFRITALIEEYMEQAMDNTQ